MVTEKDIKVIVFISSNRKHELERYLSFWHSCPLRNVEPRRRFDSYELWPLTLSQNGKAKTTYLYHHSKWFDEKCFCEFTKNVRENPEYLTRPIVVCSSEGEGPNFVYCILDCMMGIKTSEGFEEDLNECAKRLACERMGLVKNKKNMQRLRKCCEYVLRDGQTEVKQTESFCVTFGASPWICRIGFIVLPLLFIVIIACTGIMIYKCNE
ncbi:uncharacterized protein LOC124272769 [Haliotis rubra]|uniref:uncharacterized protein LOC124272769 n=1 Tax=Haliotis rubra TaxID=36100 RepID=UPI001EE5EBB9|nr:uncharacterized protein LOC124272769 [Haliotis rubra]